MSDQPPSHGPLAGRHDEDAEIPGDPHSFHPEGIGLCLSGGGYKAAAYHLGALERLNELGILRRIARISSVSGGSITAGFLGLKWTALDGSADNFREVIVRPLTKFLTGVDIDIPAVVQGLLLPFRSGADGVAAAYDKHLFGGASLQDLPAEGEGPRFVILATNYQLNSLWRFSRPYAADHRIGMIQEPKFPLARVVAASSGFPPVFCPIDFDLTPYQVLPLDGADMHRDPYTRRVELADGGIYDNMGLEPIWKRYGVLLVSNAGDPFKETSHPPEDWLTMLRRILGMVHRQAENNRQRWLMAMAQQGSRKVAYWPLRNLVSAYPAGQGAGAGWVALSDKEALAAQEEDVRLWSLKPEDFRRLYQHGYSLADVAVRSYLGVANTPPARLPEPPA